MQRNAILELFPIGPEHIDSRRFDPVTAIIGGGSMAMNLIGGSRQAKAAKQAGELQKAAAAEAVGLVGQGVNEANAPIGEATAAAQQGVTTAANYAVDTAGAGANRALDTASQSNALLNPYATAGGTAADYLNQGVAAGGDFNKKYSMSDLQMDPGFAFRLQQGQLALERSAAARGGAMGGGAMKDLAGYSQGLASEEYGKAFDRYQTDTAQRYARLFGTAGMGLDASSQQANNLNTAARYAGDINMQGAGLNLQGQTQVGEFGQRGAFQMGNNAMQGAALKSDIVTGRGNAEGASKMAQGEAWNNAFVGAGNSAMDAYALYKGGKLKNPAVSATPRKSGTPGNVY
jgi:hypothetical protein